MPILIAFRRSPVRWVAPLLLVLVVAFARASVQPAADNYPLALTVAGASMVFLIAPICAACAAWEADRLRRAGWFVLPRVRSLAVFLLSALAPVLVMGLVALIVAILLQFRGAPAPLAPDLPVSAVAYVVVAAHTLVGFAVGAHVPAVVAAPAVLLVDYAWMVLPPAFEPLWLRHLTGAWTGCCSVSSTLSPRALAGVAVLATGLALAAVSLTRSRVSWQTLAVAVAVIAVAGTAAGWLVHTLGPDPAVARTGPLVCSDGTPQVCVWPEDRDRLGDVAAIAEQTYAAWQHLGIAIPDRFTIHPPARFRESDIVASLAYATLPQPPDCARTGTTPWAGGVAAPYVVAWLAAAAGVPPSDLGDRLSPAVIDTVQAVRALSLPTQVEWVRQNLAAISDCGVQPSLQPPA